MPNSITGSGDQATPIVPSGVSSSAVALAATQAASAAVAGSGTQAAGRQVQTSSLAPGSIGGSGDPTASDNSLSSSKVYLFS